MSTRWIDDRWLAGWAVINFTHLVGSRPLGRSRCKSVKLKRADDLGITTRKSVRGAPIKMLRGTQLVHTLGERVAMWTPYRIRGR